MKRVRDLVLSASAIGSFKFCPMSFFYKYILGIRQKADTDPQRIGNAWHEALDIMATKPETPCKLCASESKNDPDCYLCGGSGFIADPFESLARMLDYRYSPSTPLAAEQRRVERSMMLSAVLAYEYNYQDSVDYSVVMKERPFRIPLIDPRTRRAVPGVYLDGMLDKLVRREDGSLAIIEHKSTSRDLGPDSTYWGHLKLDTQISLYVYAIQRLQAGGELEPLGIKPDDLPICDIIYDVWRKPQIKPKKLSAADTAAFIEDGQYFGAVFDVVYHEYDDAMGAAMLIDGEEVALEHNKPKKGQVLGDPVISEAPEMFGARVLDTITSEPDRYFCRKLISRTPEEIERFEKELFAIYQTVEQMTDSDSWYHNEYSCEATFKCDFISFCYSGHKLDPKHPPAGFVNIFDKKEKKKS